MIQSLGVQTIYNIQANLSSASPSLSPSSSSTIVHSCTADLIRSNLQNLQCKLQCHKIKYYSDYSTLGIHFQERNAEVKSLILHVSVCRIYFGVDTKYRWRTQRLILLEYLDGWKSKQILYVTSRWDIIMGYTKYVSVKTQLYLDNIFSIVLFHQHMHCILKHYTSTLNIQLKSVIKTSFKLEQLSAMLAAL